MKKIVLKAALIISVMIVMLVLSCKAGFRNMDERYRKLYNANTGLDLTGAGTYTVRDGDTLSEISRRFYNDSFFYPVIMLASRGVIINPDKIKPGMTLTIPDLERNIASSKSRRSMKNCLHGFANIEKTKLNPNQALIDGFRKRADEL